ncbi:GDP-L-fucose synthase [Hymenobacter sp. DH14]|uniref:GDP-L-fucose synthase n=1 Tax=Hymenobacter cyanobacteriorum TaxID=2926463 RepID=A0A9X1VHS6_9BACT|nr:GDP-L-fucose synthase [Hymenobacter cyanobacteriorum]MCI1188908.1 GDP-L-fucose synthase [Hymenobacter cyanobacteriorum]
MEKNAKIYVAGHRGMVGSALVRRLKLEGYHNLVVRTSQELDLRKQVDVAAFFETEKPEYVLLAAAKVGGIQANNTYPADFLLDNLQLQTNVIEQSHQHSVRKLLFLGSSCVYPKMCPQPIREEYLLTSPLEPTNEAYAIAKIAGIKLCEYFRKQHGCDYISAMPTNLYGPGDNYDLANSHVLPAMLRKFHEAKMNGQPEVVIWGSGTPRREFLHVDDLAIACLHLLDNYSAPAPINVGTGEDLTILELAELVRNVTGYTGNIQLDATKPDGTPRKLLDVSRLRALGWEHHIDLREGIARVYQESFGTVSSVA